MKSKKVRVRKLSEYDFDNLKNILQNEKLMAIGWWKVYSEFEVGEWLKKINNQYADSGN